MVQYVTLKDSIHAYGTQKMFGSIGAASISFLVGIIIDGNYLRTLSQYSIIFFFYVILSLTFLVVFDIILKDISENRKDLHTAETANIESNETEIKTPFFLTNDSINNSDIQTLVCKQNIIASTDIVGELDAESKTDMASSTKSNDDADIVDTTFSLRNENTTQSTNINISRDTLETLNEDSSKYDTPTMISVTVEPSIACNAAQSTND